MVIKIMRLKSAALLMWGVFVLVSAGAVPGAAQDSGTASSVTPESFQPPLQKLGGALVFSGATGTRAPAGAEQIGITLSGVNLSGGLPQMAAANAAFEARLTRGRVAVSELFNAVGTLEEAYANAGYVLARVVLPQQSLRDGGVLKVTVVNGFVEQVEQGNAKPQVQARLDALTAPLVGRPGLTLAEIERQLLLAGDTAGVALGSSLGAGQQAGGTVLRLDPEYKQVTGFVGFDNANADELGPETFNAGVELNSPFSYGETFYLRGSGAAQDLLSSNPRYRVIAGGVVVPIGISGLAFNAEFTTSDTTPDNAAAPTRSNFDRQSLRLIYPFIRSRQLNVSTQFSIDRQQDEQALFTAAGLTPIYEDSTTVLRFGGNVNYLHDDGAVTDVGAVLSRGVDAWGARSFADVGTGTPLSRQGADAEFTKLSLSAFHQRNLSQRVSLSVTARAQFSFGDPLVTSERFGLAGARELSGFDSGTLRGDSGWMIRAEVAHRSDVQVANTALILSPYAFVAAGSVSIEQPTAVEVRKENAQSYGIGLDIFPQTTSQFRSSSLRIELAKGERDNGSDNTRFSISGNFRF